MGCHIMKGVTEQYIVRLRLTPVHINRGVPPELMSDTNLDEELQHRDHPIEDDTKEEGECTDEDD